LIRDPRSAVAVRLAAAGEANVFTSVDHIHADIRNALESSGQMIGAKRRLTPMRAEPALEPFEDHRAGRCCSVIT
jgi:hypothetical protein